jgi:type II restriction enzyme
LDSKKIENFLDDSGLKNIFINSNLVRLQDYILGIEVGLDTHSRKNRFGKLMEQTIEDILIFYQVNYKTQFEFVIGNEKKKFDFY